MKNILKFCLENKILFGVVGLLLAIGLFCWQVWEPGREFGLNFTTEILGVIVTVFIIDRLIKQREERKSIPLKLAAYEDVRMFITKYAIFWQYLYRNSVPEDDPDTLEEFFSHKGMGKIWENLYIKAEIGNPIRNSMWKHLSDNVSAFKRKSDQLLERHANVLDPQAYKFLHQLAESWCIGELINLPESFQGNTERYGISILASYCSFPALDEDYKPIIGLIHWCEKTKPKLRKYDPEMRNVFIYASYKHGDHHHYYMIPDDILEKEKQKMQSQ